MQPNFQVSPPLSSSNGAAAAYGSVIRQTEDPRDIEYRVFEQITSAMQAVASPGTNFATKIRAVHRNRELWQTLAADLAASENALPEELRAGLLNLAIWVTRETDRVMHNGVPLHDLIEINYSIMRGLRPPPAEVS
ncbi:MAG TPA: flagellar biosynthesis regulator FlaF [Acetobacteraceae bacterium]|jgi:flagellar biosynthesis activator protein FlaF|nr:flagellar biosynthesis regulator FlaF [Acetobacteraceae bacterium]